MEACAATDTAAPEIARDGGRLGVPSSGWKNPFSSDMPRKRCGSVRGNRHRRARDCAAAPEIARDGGRLGVPSSGWKNTVSSDMDPTPTPRMPSLNCKTLGLLLLAVAIVFKLGDQSKLLQNANSAKQ